MSKMWERFAKIIPGVMPDNGSGGKAVPKRADSKYLPGAVIDHEYDIYDRLRLASGQRCECQIDLFHNKKRYSFLCHFSRVTEDLISLAYVTDNNRIPLVPGLAVTVYFQVQQFGKTNFYAFTQPISNTTHEHIQQYWLIDFAVPQLLECRQRRATLRASLEPNYIKRIMMWSVPKIQTGNTSLGISTWGKPLLVFLPSKAKQVELKDISATGVRLRLPYEEVYKRPTEYTMSKHYALLITLSMPETGSEESFLGVVRVQNQKTSDDLLYFDIGTQYIAISPTPKDAEEKVVWTVLHAGTLVEKLAKWITAFSLEDLRKNKKFDF